MHGSNHAHTHYANGKTTKTVIYLVALIVGKFDGISQTSRHVITTVYTIPGKARQAEFYLEAIKCLAYFQERYTEQDGPT